MAKSLTISFIFLAVICVIQAYPQAMSSQTTLIDTQKEELFQKIDKDGNGWISKRELRKYVKAANKELEEPKEGITNKSINEIFDVIDTDGNKKVNLEEFKSVEANIPKKRGWNISLFENLGFCFFTGWGEIIFTIGNCA